MTIILILLAIIVGIAMGLIGGGGSILTLPIMTYVKGVNPILATSYSLFVVGTTALIGMAINIRKKNLHFKTVFIFGLPSILSLYLTRLLIIPEIPDTLFSLNGFIITKDIGIMLLFAILMFMSAISMIRSKVNYESTSLQDIHYNYFIIAAEGILVGFTTGLVGTGGGFLIIPVLVLSVKLPMKIAIGTSLTIVAIKSLLGFVGDLQTGMVIEWSFLLLFSFFSIIGIFIGLYLSNFISGALLKKSFGYFVLIMSLYIIIRELL